MKDIINYPKYAHRHPFAKGNVGVKSYQVTPNHRRQLKECIRYMKDKLTAINQELDKSTFDFGYIGEKLGKIQSEIIFMQNNLMHYDR